MRQRNRRVRRRRKTYQSGILRRRIGGHARRMARALGALSAVPDKEPRCRLSPTALIINYGCTTNPSWVWRGIRWLNHPHAVAISCDKRASFEAFDRADVPTLAWTTNQSEARQWLIQEKTVFARTLVRGSRGDGIVVCEPNATLPSSPLYTCNFPKTHEFRLHVAGGRVVDFVEKKARTGMEQDRAIRNHSGGWIFAHEDLSVAPSAFNDIAVNAVGACCLDFGAVDVLAILRERRDSNGFRMIKKAIVCEVNSSPAWECTATFNAYQEYFRASINRAPAYIGYR